MAVINIPAGVYSQYQFHTGNSYVGAGTGKTIIRNNGTAPFTYAARIENARDIGIRGVTFDGNGIYLGNITNLVMTDFEIVNARRTSSNHQGIYFTGLHHAEFVRGRWYNDSHAVMGYGADDVTFVDCVVEECGYGIKVQLGSGARSLLIDRSIFRRMQATMGVEIQGDDPDIDGVTLRDCAYVLPILNDDDNQNKHAFAWSLPMAKSKNVLVTRCYVDGTDTKGRTSTPQFKGVRLAHEVGGTRPAHTQNWVRNVNDPGAITTSTAAQCNDNRVENCLEPWNYGAPANGIPAASVGSKVENNGPGVALPLVGGWTLVGVSSGGTPPDPPPANDLEARVAVLESLALAHGVRLDSIETKLQAMKAVL